MLMKIILTLIVILFQIYVQCYQTVLITGGLGFVGRHFTKKYCDLGYHVTIVDSLVSDSSLKISKWPTHLQSSNCNIKFYKMDCRDYFKSSISNHHYDIFIHLAAIIGGIATIEGNPIRVAEDLAIDSAAFIYAVERCKPVRMIYMSSSAAYPIKYQGNNDNKTILNEDMINLTTDIAMPDMSYGWSKLTGEYLAQLAAKQYGLNVSIYRPMSGYGEDQHISYPFNSILQQVLRKEDPISIWSDTIRDFIHIDDIVDCVIDSMDKATSYEAINLGSGLGTSFTQLAQEMAKQVGYSPNINILEGKPTSVHFRVADTGKFQAIGCSNKISLQQGIAKAIEFSSSSTHSSDTQTSNEITKPTQQYSQVFCTSGTQYIPCSNLQKTADTFPHSNSYKRRICKFQDVCRINGTYTYFANPNILNPLLSFTDGKLLRLGYKSLDWTINSQVGHVPSNIPYSNTAYNLLYETSFSDNFGHFLIDDMLPQFFALDMWDIPTTNDISLVISKFCELKEITARGSVDIKSPLNPNITRNHACMKKYKEILRYVFNFPVQTDSMEDMCYKYLIAGQSHTFSLNSLTLERGGFLRKFRNVIVNRSGLSHLLSSNTKEHRIWY